MIVENKNDYFIQVKKNQKKLFNQIQKEFQKQIFIQHNRSNITIKKEKNKGRLEIRVCHKVEIENCNYKEEFGKLKELGWTNLNTIVMIQSYVKKKGKNTEDYQESYNRQYFISSQRKKTTNYYLELKRNHWSIESHHYIKDMTYKEDKSKITSKNHPQNNSLLRSLAISIYKSIGSTNQAQSIRRYSNDIKNLWKFINDF